MMNFHLPFRGLAPPSSSKAVTLASNSTSVICSPESYLKYLFMPHFPTANEVAGR